MSDQERIARVKERIRALKQMTTDQGCTEAEAMEAARLALQLMDKYQVSDDELDMGSATLPGVAGRRAAADELWWTVGRICRCKPIRQPQELGRGVTFTYYGRTSDVAVAEYLHGLLAAAIVRETESFRQSEEFRRRRKRSTRNAAVKAFHEGMVHRLENRLWQLWWMRAAGQGDVEQVRAEDRQLLDCIDAILADRGMKFTTAKNLAPPPSRFNSATIQGDRVGRGISIDPGLANSAPAGLLR